MLDACCTQSACVKYPAGMADHSSPILCILRLEVLEEQFQSYGVNQIFCGGCYFVFVKPLLLLHYSFVSFMLFVRCVFLNVRFDLCDKPQTSD